ncbi:Inner spore coat protein H [Solibacillus isronensis B3W22]|uniref:Inner spore coat protein H n=1 Tax=Solibacillus isronensis B3W22 TaxID=1224748 RepID=K1L215_9BACL|nr:spore coat protein [Solibacillus silvestris]EKB46162.1 Inner spore coat protein H [Solibacillus isronensis B3W22]
MKVRTRWLVVPIILTVAVVIAAVYGLKYFNVEKSTAGYDYKEQLFKEDELAVVEITVSDSNWNKILDNPTAEEYVEAKVTINGEAYDNVGVRAKGNSSLSSVANSDSERYSLKVDFAQYDTNQTFYGLEKINLNNNFSDTTQMKEFVSYELMEQLGIVTPAHSYVKVLVNGEYYGLMLAVEEIGEAFAKTNFGSTEGFIFKPEGDGSDLAYKSDDTDDYAGIFDEVKMNKKTAEKNSNIINMMKEISEGDTSSVNIDEAARYFALNTALVSMDSYQGSFKHNYYLYEDENGQFSVIPWDYNMSFGGFGGGGGRPDGQVNADTGQNNEAQTEEPTNNPPQINGGMGGGGMMLNETIITESNINFSITEPVSGTTVDARPLLKIILENEEARALYDGYLEKIAAEILTEQNVLAITTKLQDLLQEAVEEDPSKFATTEQFLAGVSGEQSLPEFAKQRSESILKQLAGEIEGVSGAGSGFGGAPGGEMNGEMSEMNGQAPPDFGNNGQGNANQGRGNRPQINGQLPANGENGAQDGPPEMNGEMPNFEDMPEMNGEMPNFENMPQMNGMPGQPRTNDAATGSSKQTIIILAASFAAVIIAIGAVVILSRRKYKKG